MMRRTFHTPAGEEERELSEAEVTELAARGDSEAKLELARKEWKKAVSVEDKIEVIRKLLGL